MGIEETKVAEVKRSGGRFRWMKSVSTAISSAVLPNRVCNQAASRLSFRAMSNSFSAAWVLALTAHCPAENPFSTRRTRPGALPFIFSAGQDAETLISRLRENRWWGEILGPHGAGKSALLATLIPAAERAGRRPLVIELHDKQKCLPRPELDPSTLLIVDGYEQLQPLEPLAAEASLPPPRLRAVGHGPRLRRTPATLPNHAHAGLSRDNRPPVDDRPDAPLYRRGNDRVFCAARRELARSAVRSLRSLRTAASVRGSKFDLHFIMVGQAAKLPACPTFGANRRLHLKRIIHGTRASCHPSNSGQLLLDIPIKIRFDE